ncbi:MAG: hypothetical protein WBM44_14805 [Waterburya sp.]
MKFLDYTQDSHLRWSTVGTLGKIGKGNAKAINTLVQLLKTLDKESKENDFQLYQLANKTAESLTQILESPRQMMEVVTELKDCKQLSACHQVLWHCAQNLTYPEFFQAWNPSASRTSS